MSRQSNGLLSRKTVAGHTDARSGIHVLNQCSRRPAWGCPGGRCRAVSGNYIRVVMRCQPAKVPASGQSPGGWVLATATSANLSRGATGSLLPWREKVRARPGLDPGMRGVPAVRADRQRVTQRVSLRGIDGSGRDTLTPALSRRGRGGWVPASAGTTGAVPLYLLPEGGQELLVVLRL